MGGLLDGEAVAEGPFDEFDAASVGVKGHPHIVVSEVIVSADALIEGGGDLRRRDDDGAGARLEAHAPPEEFHHSHSAHIQR